MANVYLLFESRGDIPEAITIALENAPYGPGVDEAKVLKLTLRRLLPRADIIRRTLLYRLW